MTIRIVPACSIQSVKLWALLCGEAGATDG
jgi:hypothetical protein